MKFMYNDPTIPMFIPPPPQPQKKWYQRSGGIVLLLFLFFPAGLYLMWRYATWNKGVKWIVTGIFAFLVLINSMNSQASTNNVIPATATQQVAQTHTTPTIKPTPTRTPEQATPTPTPTLKPTSTPKPEPTPTQESTQEPPPAPTCDGTLISGVCYTFTGGSLVYSPVPGFCSYFSCISSFWGGAGYVVQCNDGMFSKSGGRSGSCSRHGGNMRPIYQH
jgi:hypothetical protein